MKVDDATLMAFHDGELDPETARRIELARLTDERLNARLDGLEQLGDFVRVWARASDVRRVPLRVPPRPARARGARVVGAAALALAGLALFVPGTKPGAPSELLPDAGVVLQAGPRAPLAPAVAVESVDFGAQRGEVFLVESARSETTVVWLAEAPAPSATGTL
jgi:anti-sigma factor RsiW